MKRNNFKTALKADVPLIKGTDFNNCNNTNFNNCNNTNLLLLKLGLFPMPENVQASISDDGKYLNLNLKENSDKKHLLFQFPLEENDLSALKNSPDHDKLIKRYHLYTNDYVNEVKKYAMQERAYLQQKFPGLVFNIKIRIKSFDSYKNKLNENILKGKNPYINDIMAERIIISEYNGNTDETILEGMCDEIAKALYDFRLQTNFRMKKDVESNEAHTNNEYITKDYINHPKKNGYKSLHILMEYLNNKDFTYETQIRTLEMESLSKTSGEIAHTKYKPRLLNDLSPDRVPIYSEISCFTDEFGNPQIVDIPFENRFYHFYNSGHADHSTLKKKSNPITYNKFRKELLELESLLGIPFEEIRKRLRNINLRKKSKQEVR